MDELEISGKRYISSRRAGKEHKYHPDYIGQLVRAGKVDGQKVGRAWYVNADSLAEYLGKEAPVRGPIEKTETPIGVAAEQEVEAPVETPIVEEVKQKEPKQEKIIEKHIAEIEVERPVLIQKIEEKPQEEKVVPLRREPAGGLRYVAHQGAFFPELEKSMLHHVTRMPTEPAQEPLAADVVSGEPDEETEIAEAYSPRKKISSGGFLKKSAFALGVGVLIFIAVSALSSMLVSTTKVQKGQPAAAGYSFSMNWASF